MRLLSPIAAAIALSIGLGACGGTKEPADATTTTVSNDVAGSITKSSTHKNDRDNDGDNNDDDYHVLAFGHQANSSERQTITALVTRYYAAAAAENGAKACSLLTPFVAESLPEEYGHGAALHGKTCAAVMTKLFKRSHHEVANKNASLKIMRIGIEGDKSLVALEFPTIPEVRQVTARLDNNRWTMLTLLDGILE